MYIHIYTSIVRGTPRIHVYIYKCVYSAYRGGWPVIRSPSAHIPHRHKSGVCASVYAVRVSVRCGMYMFLIEYARFKQQQQQQHHTQSMIINSASKRALLIASVLFARTLALRHQANWTETARAHRSQVWVYTTSARTDQPHSYCCRRCCCCCRQAHGFKAAIRVSMTERRWRRPDTQRSKYECVCVCVANTHSASVGFVVRNFLRFGCCCCCCNSKWFSNVWRHRERLMPDCITTDVAFSWTELQIWTKLNIEIVYCTARTKPREHTYASFVMAGPPK